jgi:hypothetical protein
MKERGMFNVVVLSAGNRREAGICLKLITSKPKFAIPFEMFSAGAVNESDITVTIGFWDSG